MQVTQADEKSGQDFGVEEDIIKFRPSPNFKNMKKFLKNRSNTETTKQASPTLEPDPQVFETINMEVAKPVVLPPLSAVKEVQPPLPPYPPPPNSPPKFKVVIKQEKEIDGNYSGIAEVHPDPVSKPLADIPSVEQNIDRPKRTICKEFIRGNCNRLVCKYAHEVDVSQLNGVYTFCWDYQNAVCTFPKCKYVHATFFEEAEFYRTGVLPPHVRAQLQKQKQAPSRPPPEEHQQEMRPTNFANPPPPLHQGPDKTMPVISCIPTFALQRQEEECRALLPRTTSPLKRARGELDEFSRSPRDLGNIEHLAKRCKHCDLLDCSLNYNKEVIDDLIQSSEEMNKKIVQLNKKSTKLFHVLSTLLKPSMAGKTGLNSCLVNGPEKEKSMLEHISNFAVGNNRFSSAINDDSIKNMVGNNMNLSSLMAKLLCSAGEQVLPQDSSRET